MMLLHDALMLLTIDKGRWGASRCIFFSGRCATEL
jgi:hypothetical protein